MPSKVPDVHVNRIYKCDHCGAYSSDLKMYGIVVNGYTICENCLITLRQKISDLKDYDRTPEDRHYVRLVNQAENSKSTHGGGD